MDNHREEKKKVFVFGIVIVVFLLFAVGYFFVFRYFSLMKIDYKEGSRDEVKDLQLSPIQKLTYREDVGRFLDVYFNQKFEKVEDKKTFLELELNRFSSYHIESKVDAKINDELVALLGRISKNMVGGQDISAEDALLKLKEQLK